MPDPGNVSTVSTSRQVSHSSAAGLRMASKYTRLASAASSCRLRSLAAPLIDGVGEALKARLAFGVLRITVAMGSIWLFSVEILRPQLDDIHRRRRLIGFPAPVVALEPLAEPCDLLRCRAHVAQLFGIPVELAGGGPVKLFPVPLRRHQAGDVRQRLKVQIARSRLTRQRRVKSILLFLRESLNTLTHATLCNSRVALCNSTVALCNTGVALCNSFALTVALCNSCKPLIFCGNTQLQAGLAGVGVDVRAIPKFWRQVFQIPFLNQNFQMPTDGCPIQAEEFGDGVGGCATNPIFHLAKAPHPTEDGCMDKAMQTCH